MSTDQERKTTADEKRETFTRFFEEAEPAADPVSRPQQPSPPSSWPSAFAFGGGETDSQVVTTDPEVTVPPTTVSPTTVPPTTAPPTTQAW